MGLRGFEPRPGGVSYDESRTANPTRLDHSPDERDKNGAAIKSFMRKNIIDSQPFYKTPLLNMIMPLTLEQAREHKRAYDRTYFRSPPYSDFTKGTNLVTLGEHIEKLKKEGFKDENLPRTDGLSLDDYCLVVSWREKPPKDVPYPNSYGSLRIFYKIEKGIGF